MLKYLKVYAKILSKDKQFRSSFLRNLSRLYRESSRVKQNGEKPVLISLTEHMGDVIAAEPIAAHLRSQFPNTTISWCVNTKYTGLVRHNPAIDSVIDVSCIAEWILLKKIFSRSFRVFDLHIDGRSCSKYKLTNKNTNRSGIHIFNYLEYGSLLEVFAASGRVKGLNPVTPEFHFSGLPADNVQFDFPYLVIHTQANDPERNWTTEGWNNLVEFLFRQCPQLHVIEIGLEGLVKHDSPRFHNHCGKFNLQQNASIIRNAKYFIGVESGFAHFANAIGTSSLVMIGHYQHYRNYQVYSGRFAEGKDVILHYFEGRLDEMNFPEIRESLFLLLGEMQTAS